MNIAEEILSRVKPATYDVLGGGAGGLIAYWASGSSPTILVAIAGAFLVFQVAVMYWAIEASMSYIMKFNADSQISSNPRIEPQRRGKRRRPDGKIKP